MAVSRAIPAAGFLAWFLYQYRQETDETMMTTTNASTPMTVRSTSQQVVVVSKQSQLNGLLETVLDAGQYDVVFVESTEHAYSHIKRLTPHLIIVCLDIDDLDGFQVLSMLKLDDETKAIPVVTCTVSQDDEVTRDESIDPPDDVFSQPAMMQLN
jgi:CheY-like chemotaxis protein